MTKDNEIYTGNDLQRIIEFVTPTGINPQDFVLTTLEPQEHYRIEGKPCNGETDINKDPMQVCIYVPKNMRLPLYAGRFKFKLNTRREVQVYSLAHELYHVWQVKCDFYTFLFGRRLGLIDDESEETADKYSITKLTDWRKISSQRR